MGFRSLGSYEPRSTDKRTGVTGTPRVATPGHSALLRASFHGRAGRINPVTQPLRAELHGLAATESATGRLAAVRGPARSGTKMR